MMRERTMRDHAVRNRVMDRIDRAMERRDRRNPYGSRGGYVVSDKRYDMARGRGYDRRYDRMDGYDREYDRYERDRAGDYRDYESDYAMGGGDYRRDYRRSDYAMTGGVGDYRGDYNDYGDYRGYDRGYDRIDRGDYGEDAYTITKKDMEEWKHSIVNSDGTRGEHFQEDKILNAAQQMGIRFDKYDERDFAMTANMLYSDYGKTLKTVVSPDREAHVYAALAKDFLEDQDASIEGAEKLAVYYNCIVKDE